MEEPGSKERVFVGALCKNQESKGSFKMDWAPAKTLARSIGDKEGSDTT